jgi:hypothetical protein
MSASPGALPGWFHRRAQDDSPADSTDEVTAESSPLPHATTAGGKDDQTPVVVWEAANRMEAEIVAGRLHSEGIPAIIRGEALGTIYGLTTGTLAAANVLVPALLAEKAIAILSSAVEWDESEQIEQSEDASSAPDTNLDS